jgi:hypothetical protein
MAHHGKSGAYFTLNSTFSELCYSSENMALEEVPISFKGKVIYYQYILINMRDVK